MEIKKDELVKEILKMHFETGKTKAEIARALAAKYEGWIVYNKEINQGKGKEIHEEYLYLLSQNTISIAKKKMTASDLEKFNKNREEIQQQEETTLKLEIAESVRRLYLDLAGSENSGKSFNRAIEAVARRTGLKNEIVKNYTIEVFPYLHTPQEDLETPEFYIDFAERIIRNDTYITIASKNPGYLRMRKFIKENRPDLHEKLEEIAGNHIKQTIKQLCEEEISDKTKFFKSDAKELLVQIMLHFRVPVEVVAQFVNNHANLFLKNTDQITPEQLIQLKSSLLQMEIYAFNFLFAENMKEFEEYRIAKFNFFIAQLDLLADDREKQLRFIKSETNDNVASIFEKTNDHIPYESYNFTQEEIRNILYFIYKYGLTSRQAAEYFGMSRLHKQELFKQLHLDDSPEDQVLVKGHAQLSEFTQEIIRNPKR